jgi:hypothetical protein
VSESVDVIRALGPVKKERVDLAIGRMYFDGDDLVIEAGLEFLYAKEQHFKTPPLFRHKIPLKSFRLAAKGWHGAVDEKIALRRAAALPVEGL